MEVYMYYAYIIENTINHTYYVGITSNPKERWQRHLSNARSDSHKMKYTSYLYNAIRSYGEESFIFDVVASFESREECELFEISTIEWFNKQAIPTYNIHSGGTLGCSMRNHPNYEEWKQKQSDFMQKQKKEDPEAFKAWKEKLSKARQKKQPALGMKHTEANKKLFSKVSNDYWSTQDTYLDHVDDILKLSHKEAKAKFGISTTHYYRLKKRFTTNDSE